MIEQGLKLLGDTAVVIPCFNAAESVGRVVGEIPSTVGRIICVDDASTDDTLATLHEIAKRDHRVDVIARPQNGGVGAATVTGYKHACALGARIIVKIDSDGQMNPAFIEDLIAPIIAGEADYVKGNRFFSLEDVRAMPFLRLVGNAGLSFMTKLSTGYWDLFDPTNGFSALHADVAGALPLDKLHKRYFFETDMLFRLRSINACVVEVPMEAVYGAETSHLSEMKALLTFPGLHLKNFTKRILYNYFLRGFSVASLNLVLGIALCSFGIAFGASAWIASARVGMPATAGTVMLSATPLLIGIQLLLSFLTHDVSNTPRSAIHRRLGSFKVLRAQDRIRKRSKELENV